MRLTLDALTVLDAIDRNGSLPPRPSYIAMPSAVTYAVQKLEQDLGVSIFDRRAAIAQADASRPGLKDAARWASFAGCTAVALAARAPAGLGWETELAIAVSDLLPMAPVLELVRAFDALHGRRHAPPEPRGVWHGNGMPCWRRALIW